MDKTHAQTELKANPKSLTNTTRWALVGLTLSMLMSSLDTSITNAGLPALARAFGASFPNIQWVVIAYLLAITCSIVGAGRLGDLVGRRRLLLVGIGLFTLASIACGFAPTLGFLIAARAAQGLGAAIMLALTVALAGEVVPRDRTGSAMGLLGTMSALGTTLGPSLGGLLMSGFGWRAIFLINVPLGVLNFFLVRQYLPAEERRIKTDPCARFDGPGTVLLAVALAAYSITMTLEGNLFSSKRLGLLFTAAAAAGVFVLVERRASSPLVQFAMFRTPALFAGLATAALVSTVMMATLVVGPFYLSRGLGLESTLVGLALSVGPLVAAVTGLPAGRLVDRFGAGRMTTAGLVGLALGATLLASLPAGFGITGYLAPIVILTASYAIFQAANNTGIMTGIGVEQRGAISGMLALARNLGLITGASFMGALFASAVGSSNILAADPRLVAVGMRTSFAVAALLIVIALGVGIWSRVRSSQTPPTEVAPGKFGWST